MDAAEVTSRASGMLFLLSTATAARMQWLRRGKSAIPDKGGPPPRSGRAEVTFNLSGIGHSAARSPSP